MENKLPHQVLFDCEILLQEIGKKYPQALNDVEKSIKDIMDYYQNGENSEYPYTIMRVVYKGKAKPQPYYLDDDY